jgi:hypothetical protein
MRNVVFPRTGPRFGLLLAGAALAACSASNVRTSIPETSRYAPVNEQVDGEVSYLNAGAKTVRNARREDAYKKMHDHCGGAYEIVREEDQEAAWPPGGRQRRICFKCVGQEAAAKGTGG